MSSTMTDTVSGVEIPPIQISLDGNKAIPSIMRVLPAVEKIITVIVSRDGITKVTETLRKYGDRFDYLVLGHAGNVKSWKLLKSTISTIGFEIVDLGIDEEVINILLRKAVKKVFSRHSYGFAKAAGPSVATSGHSSRASVDGRTPTPSGRRSAGIQVQATEAMAPKSPTNRRTPIAGAAQNTCKGTGGIENVDTQKGGETVEEKPTPTVYSSQRSREIKRWMARILGGQTENTREEPAPVEVVVDGSRAKAPVEVVVDGGRTKVKFAAEAMEEWLEGALAATAGVSCPSMGVPDQKLWFGKDSHSLKRKSDMIGDKVKAAITSIENLMSSRFRKKIKIARVGEGEIKPTTSNTKIEEEKPTIDKNITTEVNTPPTPAIEIVVNTPPPPPEIQAPSPPTSSSKSDKKSILTGSIVSPAVENTRPMFTTKSSRVLDNNVFAPFAVTEVSGNPQRNLLTTRRKIVETKRDENQLPMFMTKSSHVLDNNVLSPVAKAEVRAGASKSYLPTIRRKNTPTTQKYMSPTFATKSSNICDKNVLSPTTSMATKLNNNTSTIRTKGKGRADYIPTTPTVKSSTPIKNVLTSVVENMTTSDTPTSTKSSTRINSVSTPAVKKVVAAVIADPSEQSIRGKISSKIPMKHIPTTPKNTSTIRNNIGTSTVEKESISIPGQSVSGKASSKISMTRRPLANKNNNAAINKILTPNTENKVGQTSGVNFTPIKVKPTADVTLNTPIENEVKSAFKHQPISTVRKVIPAPAAAIRVSPRKYKSVRETTTPPAESVFTPTPKKKITSPIRGQSTPTVSYVESIVSPMTATKVIPTTRKNSFPASDKKVKNEKVIPTTETSPSKSTRSPAVGGIKAWPLKQTPSLYPRKGRCLDAAQETPSTLTKKRPVEIRPVRRILFFN
ncbi:hypothetical protein Q9L58_010273 [Maublancomyces gigas]|uniref:Uncharacterized protein n=1 Tax=Discina gigas TaxID=1032678 RepID=A0ABR3G4L2_9PEZI